MPRAATPPPRPAAPAPETAEAPADTPPPRSAAPDPTPVLHARRLARFAAFSAIAAILIPPLAEAPDRWNVFAVLSPFEAFGFAAVAWTLSKGRTDVSLSAGWLLALGALISVTALGLLKFTIERLSGLSTLLAVIVLLGALAALAAGVGFLRVAPEPSPVTLNPGPLVLGLVGVMVAGAALFINYDGFSSLWLEFQEGDSAEFFLEPAVIVIAALMGLGLLGSRARLAAGLLLGTGLAATLHYVGLLVAAERAIGEVGEVKAAGFIGVLGGLLILAAGALAAHTGRG